MSPIHTPWLSAGTTASQALPTPDLILTLGPPSNVSQTFVINLSATAGKVALEQAIQKTPIEGLHVLAAGAASETPPSSADALRWVLAWLRQRFDLILVDAPAWDGGEALRAILPAASAVYLVVDATEAGKSEVRALSRDVARLGSRVGGLIVAH